MISWSSIFKSKSEGDLGIKHYEAFNVALLSKWACRIIDNKPSIWTPLMSFKYGNTKDQILDLSWTTSNKKSSLWWRDLRDLIASQGFKKVGLTIVYLVSWVKDHTLTFGDIDGLGLILLELFILAVLNWSDILDSKYWT